MKYPINSILLNLSLPLLNANDNRQFEPLSVNNNSQLRVLFTTTCQVMHTQYLLDDEQSVFYFYSSILAQKLNDNNLGKNKTKSYLTYCRQEKDFSQLFSPSISSSTYGQILFSYPNVQLFQLLIKLPTIKNDKTIKLINSNMTSNEKDELSSTPFLTKTTTTITTSFFANQTNPIQRANIGLIIGIVSACVLVLCLLIYAICKYRNRDEGSYKIDESKNFGTYLEVNGGHDETSNGHKHHKLMSNDKLRNVETREWYV
ncbi:unnamed protein product [Didymodactylos carnosus]|uniref:Neurexin/syndecan/glycophorin C domain-containing protein n=1 Tax=Didymodactylos carnosus TaxID=1234261 RepID=A0A814H9D2_9BILA|nr:unnamed protein product [Didymodactylos carnosus]CAF3777734.1 unnamed protein product [Didymodactylos carnosus]